MYKILGGDGKEYGPVSAETLRQWIAEGRANTQTQVMPEGTGSWVALGSLPEFAGAMAPAVAAAMPFGTAPLNTADAGQMVAGPAIGLLVTAIIGGLIQLA